MSSSGTKGRNSKGRNPKGRNSEGKEHEYGLIYIWACCLCRDLAGNYCSSGMVTWIDRCPECRHTRCSTCPVESTKKYKSTSSISPPILVPPAIPASTSVPTRLSDLRVNVMKSTSPPSNLRPSESSDFTFTQPSSTYTAFPTTTQLPVHTHYLPPPIRPSLSTHTSDLASPISVASSFRPSKYEWEAAADWQEEPVISQSSSFKNSQYNTAHHNNPHFQPEEWTPDSEEPEKGSRRKKSSSSGVLSSSISQPSSLALPMRRNMGDFKNQKPNSVPDTKNQGSSHSSKSSTEQSTPGNSESRPISTTEDGIALSPSTVSQSPISQSRSPSEILKSQEEQICTDTEAESVSTSSENNMGDSENEEDEFRCMMSLLDSHLVTVFKHDLPFVAQLIPQVHDRVYARFKSKNVGDSGTFLHKGDVEQHASGTGGTSGPSGSSASNLSAGNSSSGSNSRKRARHSELSNGANGNRSGNRPEPDPGGDPEPADEDLGSEEDGVPRPRFACHFHKHDSRKYGPWSDSKYRLCPCPNVSVLRRIKYHFKAAHRCIQCNRCYTIFRNDTELEVHQRLPQSCLQQPTTLKEGINNGQWKRIEEALKVQRARKGAASSPRPPHDIQKWFEIWKILFPDTREPGSPWNEPSDTSQRPDRSAEELLADFERVTEHSYMLTTLLDPRATRQYYIDALQQLLGLGTAIDTDAERSEPGASESAIHSVHGVSPGTSNNVNLNRNEEPRLSHLGNEDAQEHQTMQPITLHSAVDQDSGDSQMQQGQFPEASPSRSFNDDVTGILETSAMVMPLALPGFDLHLHHLPPLRDNPIEGAQEQTENFLNPDFEFRSLNYMEPYAINGFPLDLNVNSMADFEPNGSQNIWDHAADDSISACLD